MAQAFYPEHFGRAAYGARPCKGQPPQARTTGCGLLVIAVVFRIAAAGLFRIAGKGLPGLLADRDCVLRARILRCGLRLQCLGRLNGFFCL